MEGKFNLKGAKITANTITINGVEFDQKLVSASKDLLEALIELYELAVHEQGTMIERLNTNDIVLSKAKTAIQKATS
jgi:hypothetical protein